MKMTQKESAWKATCNRFVAFLDIMGFKDLVFRNNHKEILNMLESFHPIIKQIESFAAGWLENTELEAGISLVIRPVLFSDSIVLISYSDSVLSAVNMLLTVGQIYDESIDKRIPLKGAVACGEQTADFEKSLYFGKPIIDAYELQNELLLYGVVLHHTMEKKLKELKFNDFICNYDVPMKSGRIKHFLIDWPDLRHAKHNNIDQVADFYHTVSGSPRLYIDNTIEFIQWSEKKSRANQEIK
jgi:hypothetical protein